jgi:hypothetical protein
VSKAVVLEWNGRDVPEELQELPPGKYVLARVDESVPLTEEEEAGLIAALKSAESRVIAHRDVMDHARKIVDG